MSTFKDAQLAFRDYNNKSDTNILGILAESLTVAPGTVNAGTSTDVSVTVSGAKVGDIFILNEPASLESGLVLGAVFVSAANTVSVRIANVTVGNIVAASRVWSALWFKLS